MPTPQPNGCPGNWSLVFRDEFDGDKLDTTKWDPNWFGEGGVMNDVPTYDHNVSVLGSRLRLRMHKDSSGKVSGGLVRTTYKPGRYQALPGDFVEGHIAFQGDSVEDIYNWPAFWISGQDWPAAGEHDIVEGLGGKLKTVYHYRDANGIHQQGSKVTPPGKFADTFTTFGVHRKKDSADVYWGGQLVHSYPTYDNGGPEEIIINVGKPRNDPRPLRFDYQSTMLVSYVRAWRPTI